MNQAVSTSLYLTLEKAKGNTSVQYRATTSTGPDLCLSINRYQQCTFSSLPHLPREMRRSARISRSTSKTAIGAPWVRSGKTSQSKVGLKVLPPTEEGKTEYNAKPPKLSLSLDEWSKRQENVDAWKKLTSEKGW